MTQERDDQLIRAAFAPERNLEPTDQQVARVITATDRSRRRRSWPRPGTVVYVVTSATAVAIGALAVVLLTGRPSRVSSVAGVPTAAAQLVDRLAVLRKPQTSADRLPNRVNEPYGTVRSLTRLAGVFPTEQAGVTVRIWLVVSAPEDPGLNAARGDVVSVALVSSAGGGGGGGDQQAASLNEPGNVGFGHGVNDGIVPDGVARVRWTYGGLQLAHRHTRSITIYPTVKNNLAVSPVVKNEGELIAATWYDSAGYVVGTYREP